MIRIARTHDMATVARIMRHPQIWPHIHEDGTEDADPVDHEALFWMLASDGVNPIGVFLVHSVGAVCYEMHTSILPEYWGEQAAAAAQELLRWAFTATDCQKMITRVPSYNRHALRFAEAGGMKREGINRASYLYKSKLIDQTMLGITKKEWKSCQWPH